MVSDTISVMEIEEEATTTQSGIIRKTTTVKTVLICSFIAVITMIGLVRTAYISDAFSFSVIPMVLAINVIFSHDEYLLHKRFIIYDLLLTCLFILMLSAEEVLKRMKDMDSELFNTVFRIIFLPFLFISLMIIIDRFLTLATETNRLTDPDTDDAGKSRSRFLGLYRPTWMIAVIAFVFAVAYFPGNLNNDFDPEWIGGGHPLWRDWHTVGFSLFVRLCTLIIRKPFMVTVVQYLIYVFSTDYGVDFINRHFSHVRKSDWIYAFMYLGFGAYACMNVGSMMKDNNSAPLLFVFTVAILDHILSDDHHVRDYVRLMIFGFLAAIFRHSMPAIVLAEFAVLCIYCFMSSPKNKRIVETLKVFVSGICVLIMYLLLTEGLAFGIMKFERNPSYIRYTIPMNLAASMAYRQSLGLLTIDDDIAAKMEQVIPLEKYAEYYCPWDADTTCRPWHGIGDNVEKLNDPHIASDILRVDLWYLLHYPRQCIKSFFDINSLVWEIAKASDLIMYSPEAADDFTEIHHMRKGAFFDIAEDTKLYLGSNAIGKTFIYRGGIYLYAMVVFAVTAFIKKQKRIIIAMIPILLYAALLMLSIPQEGSHYIMAFPLCAVIIGTVTFLIPQNLKAA